MSLALVIHLSTQERKENEQKFNQHVWISTDENHEHTAEDCNSSHMVVMAQPNDSGDRFYQKGIYEGALETISLRIRGIPVHSRVHRPVPVCGVPGPQLRGE